MKTVKLATFIENPDNPSTAGDEAIARLMLKLKTVPDGLKANRIAYVTDYISRDGRDLKGQCVVLSGNKRLRAIKMIYGESGEVTADWFQDISAMNTDERRAFIVNANVNEGKWIVEMLESQYSKDELRKYLRKDEIENILSQIKTEQLLDENTEIDPASFNDEMVLKFKLTREQRDKVVERLSEIDKDQKTAFLKLIGVKK